MGNCSYQEIPTRILGRPDKKLKKGKRTSGIGRNHHVSVGGNNHNMSFALASGELSALGIISRLPVLVIGGFLCVLPNCALS